MMQGTRLIVLDGGLGNNLFQLAFARYLQKTRLQDVELLLPTSPLEADSDSLVRQIALDLEFKIIEHCHYMEKIGAGLALLKRSASQRKLLGTFASQNSPTFWAGKMIYAGYWQNSPEARRHFTDVANAIVPYIPSAPKLHLAIHIRLGDYQSKRNLKIYSQLDRNYIESSLMRVAQSEKITRIFLASNDIPAAIKLIPPLERRIVEPLELNAIQTFFAIANTRSVIASNSTFCWWATFVGASAGTIQQLISPPQWLNTSYLHRDFPRYEWVRDFLDSTQ